MWFTETPWPPILIISIAIVFLVIRWRLNPRPVYLLGVVLLSVLCGAIYVVERQIVTDSERIEECIFGLADAFQQQDRERCLSYLSSKAEQLHADLIAALNLVEIRNLRITDLHVKLSAANSRATSHFRANGNVLVRKVDIGWQPSRWELTWQRENGEWKIIRVTRLHPATGAELSLFEGGPG